MRMITKDAIQSKEWEHHSQHYNHTNTPTTETFKCAFPLRRRDGNKAVETPPAETRNDKCDENKANGACQSANRCFGKHEA